MKTELKENKLRIYHENGLVCADFLIGNRWYEYTGDEKITTDEQAIAILKDLVFRKENIVI